MNIPQAVLTLWYVTTADPASVLQAEPKADRGFGRKYLAQLNPSYPVTPIGQFPLNRSATAGAGEFYIGGYPGITVVQTVVDDEGVTLSKLSPALLHAMEAEHIFAFASNESEGYAGIAHWHNYELKRSLCSTTTQFVEDIGLPEPFEGPFWAGEHAASEGALGLPFDPLELMAAAERAWLGVDISEAGPDLDVVGYAIDGRPEPKVAPQRSSRPTPAAEATGMSYDDYADPAADPEPTISEAAADAASHALALGRTVYSAVYSKVKAGALAFIKRNRRRGRDV